MPITFFEDMEKIAYEQGYEMGYERGVRIARKETALGMLKKGFSLSFIEEITGLAVDEILALQNTQGK